MMQVKDLLKILQKADPEAYVAVESSTYKMITTAVVIDGNGVAAFYHPDNVDGEYPDEETPEFFVLRER